MKQSNITLSSQRTHKKRGVSNKAIPWRDGTYPCPCPPSQFRSHPRPRTYETSSSVHIKTWCGGSEWQLTSLSGSSLASFSRYDATRSNSSLGTSSAAVGSIRTIHRPFFVAQQTNQHQVAPKMTRKHSFKESSMISSYACLKPETKETWGVWLLIALPAMRESPLMDLANLKQSTIIDLANLNQTTYTVCKDLLCYLYHHDCLDRDGKDGHYNT